MAPSEQWTDEAYLLFGDQSPMFSVGVWLPPSLTSERSLWMDKGSSRANLHIGCSDWSSNERGIRD